ncbi:MAG TPA: DUF4838 domain-containing protein [Opitutaceae bacterium]|nr:DUF4838 domain-containing protein [Opitutaceae bacterium]
MPYAVAWLLQREAGVRWYAPGALGEVIPRRDAWTLRDLAIVREPAYVSREVHGLRGEAGRDWERRNGLRRRLDYSHNLTNVFTPEVYDAHPEWFGEIGGVRRRPMGKGEYHWQPELSRADVAEFAAERAAEALARVPERASFAFGVNDTVRFDQGAGTRAVVEPLRYFREKPDYSALVFGFMNRAAESLARRPGMENRYLGCLAYFWCENPPAFRVNERVMPYVTTDRTQFYDTRFRAEDYALMSRWGRSGVRAFGLWEYAEGNAFLIPRVPHAALAESLREGWWRGARGYMGECGPHAGFDAYKIWMLAQLMWDPARTDAELADDFFGGWYGPAAEPMRRFFARCEEVWMAQSGPPWWIKLYQQQDQALLFPPEVCAELRRYLDEAATLAGGRNGKPDGECGNQELRNGAVGQGGDLAASGAAGNVQIWKTGIGTEDGIETRTRSATADQKTEAGSHVSDVAYSSKSETRNPKPETLNSPAEAVRLTSRAFAVTEAAVEFDRIRRELMAGEAERLSATELGRRLSAWQHARVELERAIRDATTGEAPAMATANIGYMLRNDPVPGLLMQLARHGAGAPQAAMRELAAAGETVPEHWRALAVSLADQAMGRTPNLLSNASFVTAATTGQEPRFLFPLSGEVPAQWELRAAPTEHGRVALGSSNGRSRVLRIEGAWDTQLLQTQPARAGSLYVATMRLRGRSSPGNDAALFLTFLDAGGARVGEYRTVMLPKGESEWRTLVLADAAPERAKYVVLGVSALRQFGGDWLEAAEASLTAHPRTVRADQPSRDSL